MHIPGLGLPIERAIWAAGCTSWSHFLAEPDRFTVGQADRKQVIEILKRSVESFESRDSRFFMERLGLHDSWRAFPDFRDCCVYLDIETDGGKSGNSITTVGLYDGSGFRALIKGKDLKDLPDILGDYRMIVTFFGAGFDLPMIQKRFKSLEINHLHIDLCPTLRRLGHRGGLKKIEKELGLSRGEDTDGLNGLDAIRLWNRYKTLGDEAALETLIAYNREDVVNLETLAVYAYEKLRAQTFPANLPLPGLA